VQAGTQSVTALGIVTAMAVLREGSEVVLFLAGIALQHADTALNVALGSVAGLLLGAVASAVLYFGLTAIPIRHLFSTTGVLVTLVAAGLAAECVHQLSNAGLIAANLNPTLWDSSWLLAENGIVGRVLRVLLGYRDAPGALEFAAYVATIATIFALSRRAQRAAAMTPAVVSR
jgi:high-affinity iron transporter